MQTSPGRLVPTEAITDVEWLLVQFTLLGYALLYYRLEENDLRISRVTSARMMFLNNDLAFAIQGLITEPRLSHKGELVNVWNVIKALLDDGGSTGEFRKPDGGNEIPISIRSRTMALRLLFEEDTLSTQGEFFAIYPGRVSHGALLRCCRGLFWILGPTSKGPGTVL